MSSTITIPEIELVNKKRLRRKRNSRKVAKVNAILGSTGMSLVMAIAFTVVFPAAPVAWPILIGLATFFIYGRKYWHDTQKTMTIMFAQGIFRNLENNLLTRELLSSEYEKEIKNYCQPMLDKLARQLYEQHTGIHLDENANLASNVKFQKFLKEKWVKKILKKTLKKRVKRAVEAWQDGGQDDLVEHIKTKYSIAAFQNCRDKIKNELKIKKVLRVIALVFSVMNGVSFGMITFTHANLAILKGLLLIFGGTGIAAAMPWLAIVLASGLALVGAFVYFQLMDRMLTKAVEKNLFRKLFHSLKKVFVPKKSFNEMTKKQIAVHIVRCVLIGLLLLGVITASVLATLAEGGTLMEQNIEFLTKFIEFCMKMTAAIEVAVQAISAVLIYLFFLPTMCMFVFENCWDAVKSLSLSFFNICVNPKNTWGAIKNYFQEVKADPKQLWKLPGYIIGVVIGIVALGLFVIGEGALAGEGLAEVETANSIPSFFQEISDVFSKLTSFVNNLFSAHLRPEYVATGIEVGVETLEHVPFIFGGDDTEHGQSFTYAAIDGTYPRLRNYFNSQKKDEVSKPLLDEINLFEEGGNGYVSDSSPATSGHFSCSGWFSCFKGGKEKSDTQGEFMELKEEVYTN